MKATELRIGNLIFQSGQITTIENISRSRSINDWERVNNKRLFDCTPIPLTEEWLLKFAFVKRKDGHYNLFKHSEVEIIINRDFDGWKCDGINFSVGRLGFVHQLQNLYFALTGEELKIKP